MTMFRYAHTDIIARDPEKLIKFYKTVFHCKSIGETRDLRGGWLDDMTGVRDAHITGEHLLLPGWGDDHPTLEIFSYDEVGTHIPPQINRAGISHIAFEVDDVEETMREVIKAGGRAYGKVVRADYPHDMEAVFVYVCDPEQNVIELQSWRHK